MTLISLVFCGGCRPKPEKAKDALVDQLGALGGPEAAKLRVTPERQKTRGS